MLLSLKIITIIKKYINIIILLDLDIYMYKYFLFLCVESKVVTKSLYVF